MRPRLSRVHGVIVDIFLDLFCFLGVLEDYNEALGMQGVYQHAVYFLERREVSVVAAFSGLFVPVWEDVFFVSGGSRGGGGFSGSDGIGVPS